ncbi:hypothetical protein HPP92_013687 [Vanilla planifolia]|uniref:Uncharacterized protein n=1 Tax=Vanilla planifolia TaxID=51239 RepID=A0A835UYN2_VANPL|nr:hypothetical protein HPP92_014136 [Vanilla planifolia]KAG0478968.1 hypothetical protein HPP92_013687 [Vanilla planifolia]
MTSNARAAPQRSCHSHPYLCCHRRLPSFQNTSCSLSTDLLSPSSHPHTIANRHDLLSFAASFKAEPEGQRPDEGNYNRRVEWGQMSGRSYYSQVASKRLKVVIELSGQQEPGEVGDSVTVIQFSWVEVEGWPGFDGRTSGKQYDGGFDDTFSKLGHQQEAARGGRDDATGLGIAQAPSPNVVAGYLQGQHRPASHSIVGDHPRAGAPEEATETKVETLRLPSRSRSSQNTAASR